MSPTPLPYIVKGTESAIPACAIGQSPNWIPSRTETPNIPLSLNYGRRDQPQRGGTTVKATIERRLLNSWALASG